MSDENQPVSEEQPVSKDELYERAHGCCEYCRSQERFATQAFSAEHVIPRSRGGTTTSDNLALACQGCNNHKYTKVQATDPVSGEPVPLFNPRRDRWVEHFCWNEDFTLVIGITPTGRATIDALQLNRIGLVNLRPCCSRWASIRRKRHKPETRLNAVLGCDGWPGLERPKGVIASVRMSDAERNIFLEAIRAAPDDVLPRLVYADWLDELGDPDGELVRLLCEVRTSASVSDAVWDRLESLIDAPRIRGRLETQRVVTLGNVVGKLRDRDQRRFACDCAERVLPLFERTFPESSLPHRAIAEARRSADGRASAQALEPAVRQARLALDSAPAPAVHLAIGADARPTSAADERLLNGADAEVMRNAADAALCAAENSWTDYDAAWNAAAYARWAVAANCQGEVEAAAVSLAEWRWQLCRAIEYRLGFVPLPTERS